MTSTPVKDILVAEENKKASRAAKGKKPYAESYSKKQKPREDTANTAKRHVPTCKISILLQNQILVLIRYVTIMKTRI